MSKSSRNNVIGILTQILQNKDGEAFDDYAIDFSVFQDDDEVFSLLGQIFICDWHRSHEDLALLFQFCKNPVVTESLFKVAQSNFSYLAWNENLPLKRKCTWALADIGTPEAKKYLEALSLSENELTSSFANKRLDNWGEELHRKRQ